MSAFTFEYCALYYLNWWLTRDEKYYSALRGNDEGAKSDALVEAAVQYRVARTLPLAYDVDVGLPRLKPILDVITQAGREEFDGDKLVPSVLGVRDAIASEYGGNDVLSLTTKFLWLRFRHPVIIYDGNARRALKAADGNLADFYLRWRAEYGRKRSAIVAACNALHTIHIFCIDPARATPAYITEIASAEWFRERVFDSYLWHCGAL